MFAEVGGIQWCLKHNLYKDGNDLACAVSLHYARGSRLPQLGWW